MHAKQPSVILSRTQVSRSCLFLPVYLKLWFLAFQSQHSQLGMSPSERKASDLCHFLETGIYKAEEMNCGLWQRAVSVFICSLP